VVGRDTRDLRHQLAQCHGPRLLRELWHVHLNLVVETQCVFLQQEAGARDLSSALNRVDPFLRGVRTHDGSHLLRVRVQDRRRRAA
jgi:hypothetical protein